MGGGSHLKQKNITEGFKVMVEIKKFEGASEISMLRHSVGGWIHGRRSQTMECLDQR